MRRRLKKNKKYNINQKSFYFEDYLETNKKNKLSKKKTIIKIDISTFFLFFSYFHF